MPQSTNYPSSKLVIVGGGISAYLEAYVAFIQARSDFQKIRISIHEKNDRLSDTTVAHLVPSLTPSEMLSVVNYTNFFQNISTPFQLPGGILANDMRYVLDSEDAKRFIAAVRGVVQNSQRLQENTELMLRMGKLSMALWNMLYDTGDDDFKQIMKDSHFYPCSEAHTRQNQAQNGYRIDLVQGRPNATQHLMRQQQYAQARGYQHCRLLSPTEVIEKDPFLNDFCELNSHLNESAKRVWNADAGAIWVPGGCLATSIFLPKLHHYLEQKMGTYTNQAGDTKNCFQAHWKRTVIGVTYDPNVEQAHISGLVFQDDPAHVKQKHVYEQTAYVFCPGEAVGTLSALGFQEPPAARFSGVSLQLTIPLLSVAHMQQYAALHQQYREIGFHGYGIAWQARCVDECLIIGVGGTKAFYGTHEPQLHQEFAQTNSVLLLNCINRLWPTVIELALGKLTGGKTLTALDLSALISDGVARVWVGSRAVSFDACPTLGTLYEAKGQQRPIDNARCTTHLSSGGVSFGPAAVMVSQGFFKHSGSHQLQDDILKQCRSDRAPLPMPNL